MNIPQKLLVQSSYDTLTYNKVTFPKKFLTSSITDLETALFFAKLYKLDARETAELLHLTVPGPVVEALTNQAGDHSSTLQDFLVEEYQDENGDWCFPDIDESIEGMPGVMHQVEAEMLPDLWESLELEIAASIEEVAAKIKDTIGHLPGKSGEMVFQTLAKVNAQRPTIGQFSATIQHQPVGEVLVVFDVSGSMSENTVRTIVDDVVGLAYEANASLAIVSNTCTVWPPGGFSTEDVLEAAEFGGTHYETLFPLFNERHWDIVITIADYDSSYSAKRVLERADGRIGELFDVSLVNMSTFLAECLGQLADKVRPLLISQPGVLSYGW